MIYYFKCFKEVFLSFLKSINVYALISSVIIFGAFEANSQSNLDKNKRLSQLVLRSWNTEDGLTSESANDIIQTANGYIWIATYTGLHRFDGRDFTVFNSQNSSIPSSNVLNLELDTDGQLWMGTLHGIAQYQNGEFITPEALEKVTNFSIEKMLITASDELWFSTKSNHLFRYHNGILKEFTHIFQIGNSTVLSIEEDPKGNIYFGTDDSQLIVYSKSKETRKIQLAIDVNGVNSLFTSNDLIYLGTGRGLFVWDGQEVSKSQILPNTTINTLTIDNSNTLWMGTMRGLFRYQKESDQLDSLTEESGMPNNIVQDLLFDQQGNLWVGTYRSGIFFLADGSITSFTKNDGLATDIISSVTEADNGAIIFGNENGVLNKLEDGVISTYNSPIPIPSERLKNMLTDKKGRIWICTYGGLIVLDGSNGKHYNIGNGFPDNFIRVAFQAADGSIWVGTKNAGLIVFNSLNSWEQITIDDGLSSNYILSIEQNENGELIIGTISGLNIIRGKEIIKTIKVEDGLPSNFMFATLHTPNYIWIASNDGLTGYSNDDRIVNFNTENGMPSNIIYDLLLDDYGTLWMPSENSIMSAKIRDLEIAAENPDREIKVKQYDKSYGMKNSHCLGAVLSYTDSNGRFWIPTLGGIVRLNPDEVVDPNFNPKVTIESIYADNERIDFQAGAKVPAGTNRLLIDFTGISYTQTDLLQFRYRLTPFDKLWVNANDVRNGLYTNLAPGSYTFELQTGIDDSFNSEVLIQEIEIEAAWWQTAWAKILLGFLIALIALLIYWLRLRSLTANNLRLEATVSERTNALELQKRELKKAIKQLKSAQEQMIQSDKMASLGILAAGVAHEINNPLNFIQGGVEGLEQTLKRSRKIKKEEYAELLRAIKEGISRASTIVLSLNEFSHSSDKKLEPCDIYHLIENCLTMIRYRLKNGIELKKEFTDENALVLGNNGKLHQAFLNIITNSIQAIDKKGSITIRTKIEGGNIMIEFIDSGHGIKPENLKKITEPFFSTKDPGKGTGLGLSITYAIINEHRGSLKYTSKWGEGTTATIKLPLIKK
ncbi:two-component regulator propeller domain-containing protein [Ekhidna sp. To15]|uniref:sensor histidine kinase n=1 Tax=Ekhidna sp. To15 TaxID=3395267 RepID=UPI003F51C0A4